MFNVLSTILGNQAKAQCYVICSRMKHISRNVMNMSADDIFVFCEISIILVINGAFEVIPKLIMTRTEVWRPRWPWNLGKYKQITWSPLKCHLINHFKNVLKWGRAPSFIKIIPLKMPCCWRSRITKHLNMDAYQISCDDAWHRLFIKKELWNWL